MDSHVDRQIDSYSSIHVNWRRPHLHTPSRVFGAFTRLRLCTETARLDVVFDSGGVLPHTVVTNVVLLET